MNKIIKEMEVLTERMKSIDTDNCDRLNKTMVLISEIKQLKEILAGIPEDSVLDRISFESRLRKVEKYLIEML